MATNMGLIENTEVIRVLRSELVATLKDNMAKHVDEYNKAIVEYRKDVIAEMTKILDSMNLGGPIMVSLKENLSAPISHEADYKKLIRKYSMSVDEHVFLDDHQFDAYVMDNWSWKRSVSNTFYASKAR